MELNRYLSDSFKGKKLTREKWNKEDKAYIEIKGEETKKIKDLLKEDISERIKEELNKEIEKNKKLLEKEITMKNVITFHNKNKTKSHWIPKEEDVEADDWIEYKEN